MYYKAQSNADEYIYSVDELRLSLASVTNRPNLAVERDNDTYTNTNTKCITNTCDLSLCNNNVCST